MREETRNIYWLIVFLMNLIINTHSNTHTQSLQTSIFF